MNLGDYKGTPAWQQAMKLSQKLLALSEELPGDEQAGLMVALRGSMVEVPTAVAVALVSGKTADLQPFVRLQAQLELVSLVYPAIDTAEAEQALNSLVDRVQTKAAAANESE